MHLSQGIRFIGQHPPSDALSRGCLRFVFAAAALAALFPIFYDLYRWLSDYSPE